MLKKIIEIAPFTQSNQRANYLFPAAAHPGEHLGSALCTGLCSPYSQLHYSQQFTENYYKLSD